MVVFAEADPALRARQPWKAAHERDYASLRPPPPASRRILRSVEQAAVERVAHELCAARAAQLLLQMCAVRLDGAHREMQLSGDLRVGVTKGEESQHLELALGEVVRRRSGLPPRRLRASAWPRDARPR